MSETTILRAGAMLLAGATGDVDGPDPAAGLYVADTRLLSGWRLRLDGRLLRAAGEQQESSGRMLALLLPGGRHEPSPILVRREQRVGRRGLVESIGVRNLTPQPRTVTLSLDAVVDFADQFAVRADGRTFDTSAAERSAGPVPGGVRFAYRHVRGDLSFTASALVTAAPAPAAALSGDREVALSWTLELPPGGHADVTVRVERDDLDARAREPQALLGGRGSDRHGPSPSPATHAARLRDRSLADLDALTMPSPVDPGRCVIGAGAPWFLTLFGRDALLTAELLGHRATGPALDALRDLAATQGHRDDPASLEQPGRIVHEVRRSELATLGMVPFGRYYGSVDATPLFLAVLGRTVERLGPAGGAPARELEASARAAVAWIRGPGGLDATGFLRFTPDPDGLLNQGWKDSPGATSFADGRPAAGAIALCEVQGYAWEGLTAVARLAREVWQDARYAAELDRVAADLRERFLTAFWLPGKDFPALALDGTDRRVDVLASNAGHLLWSGLLPRDRAAAVTGRLVAAEFHSGWGLRTVAAGQVPFAPLSYHNGSVWPHDTMITALGMRRYGHHAEAYLLAEGIVAAGAQLGFRLPELFAGFAGDDPPFPVTFERAGVPQAWSAAAGVVAADLVEERRTY